MDYNEKFESIVNGSVTDPDLKSLLKSISSENDRLDLIKQLLQKLTERTSQIISRQLLTLFIKDCLHGKCQRLSSELVPLADISIIQYNLYSISYTV